MEMKKIRSYYFVFDGTNYIGRMKTKNQGKWYLDNTNKLRALNDFENVIQRLIDFTCSIEDEMTYEFETKDDIINLLRKSWPEVMDVAANFDTRRIEKIDVSGIGWAGIIKFGADDSCRFTRFDFDEMNEFNRNCEAHGMTIDNYQQIFKARVEKGDVLREYMPVGFKGEDVVFQLAGGTKRYIARASLIIQLLNRIR